MKRDKLFYFFCNVLGSPLSDVYWPLVQWSYTSVGRSDNSTQCPSGQNSAKPSRSSGLLMSAFTLASLSSPVSAAAPETRHAAIMFAHIVNNCCATVKYNWRVCERAQTCLNFNFKLNRRLSDFKFQNLIWDLGRYVSCIRRLKRPYCIVTSFINLDCWNCVLRCEIGCRYLLCNINKLIWEIIRGMTTI